MFFYLLLVFMIFVAHWKEWVFRSRVSFLTLHRLGQAYWGVVQYDIYRWFPSLQSGWYVGLRCDIAVQGRVSIHYAVQLLLLVVALVVYHHFYFNEVYIPAQRVYSLYVSLMAISCSNWAVCKLHLVFSSFFLSVLFVETPPTSIKEKETHKSKVSCVYPHHWQVLASL